ncbi:hypothetical protein D8B26_001767 [Coccidioides posadasii str. Silveira]|uniref:Uncharacterized protein n=3 Tax=Coccidioides posadasii TaxID=199306 RepID=E9CWB9_COCPS|nr:conserved hypothetical protein [Coccidioides posadasii str. Silveira]KMM65070.1 gamma-butyrobetaine dioxygenase [Coccidioides posadasii RMSCC 3488]QVM07064.1 hypothetical protein D8B26_001767 [Coccidioides posadasii str. Silveira]
MSPHFQAFRLLQTLSSRRCGPIFSSSRGTLSFRPYSTVNESTSLPNGRSVPPMFKYMEAQAGEGSPAKYSRLFIQADGSWLQFNCMRLRDACTCSQCVDPSTKQRNFLTSDLSPDVKPKDLRMEGDKVTVTWTGSLANPEEEHVSTYSTKQLRNLNTPRPARHYRGGPTKIVWDKATFEKNQHWISFDEYMNDDVKFGLVMRSLYRYGLAFVKNVPESTESVSQIATRMGPLRNSFYGLTWDVRSVPEAKNVAYTNKFLGFHMDLLYMADPPAYQLLHCMNNSLPGGESMFVDTFRAAQRLSEDDRKTLSDVALHYGYFNDGQSYEYSRPTIQLDKSGGLEYVNYSPPFQAPHFTPADYPMQQLAESLRKFSDLLQDPEGMFELKLRPGECVIFANRRVAHARRAFDLSQSDGRKRSRWLRGAYVDEDALLSKFDIFRAKNLQEWDVATSDQGVQPAINIK